MKLKVRMIGQKVDGKYIYINGPFSHLPTLGHSIPFTPHSVVITVIIWYTKESAKQTQFYFADLN